jgi:zinc protease
VRLRELLQLSNGIKVHYKYADKEKDNVALNAVSYGGTSMVANESLSSANLLGNLISMSGLGDYTDTDLNKVLAGKTANLNVELGEIEESLSGNSTSKDVETMLQKVYLSFVKPRFDAQAFQVLENNVSNYITSRSKSINEQMKDSVTESVYGKNNPKKPILNQNYLAKVSFDKIKAVYKERFADASDFEFFIVGDVSEDKLRPLLEKYVASIPTKGIKETFKKNGAEWLSNNINKEIYLKMQNPKATVNVSFKKEMPYSISNSIYTSALGGILQLRVIETVRETEGGAYSPRAYAKFFREPKSQAFVLFTFDCNPAIADKLVGIVNAELQKIADGIINEDDFNKTKINFIKEREQSKDKNRYDMQLLLNFFRYGENMNNPENFEDVVNKMSYKNIQNIAKQVLKEGNSYHIVFKPLL